VEGEGRVAAVGTQNCHQHSHWLCQHLELGTVPWAASAQGESAAVCVFWEASECLYPCVLAFRAGLVSRWKVVFPGPRVRAVAFALICLTPTSLMPLLKDGPLLWLTIQNGFGQTSEPKVFPQFSLPEGIPRMTFS
jgi:hypothetical protein